MQELIQTILHNNHEMADFSHVKSIPLRPKHQALNGSLRMFVRSYMNYIVNMPGENVYFQQSSCAVRGNQAYHRLTPR